MRMALSAHKLILMAGASAVKQGSDPAPNEQTDPDDNEEEATE